MGNPQGTAVAEVEIKAFEILVREHHRRLLAYAQSLAGENAAAEDIVQEAFVTAYRKLEHFDASRDFGAWVRGMIRLKALESRRDWKERPLNEAALEHLERRHADLDRAARAGQEGVLDTLRACLERLADAPRRAIDLFYFKQRSCAEIAADTEIKIATVKQRLHRARESLAQCVRDKQQPVANWSAS